MPQKAPRRVLKWGFMTFKPVSKGCKLLKMCRKDVKTKEEDLVKTSEKS